MMRAPRSCCAKLAVSAKPSRVPLQPIAARLCLVALLAALSGGSAALLFGQSQQPAKPDSSQANSGQASSGQAGAQNSQPQQNSGSSAGAPMVLGEGDDQGAPAGAAPTQPPAAEPAPAQSGQSAGSSVDSGVDSSAVPSADLPAQQPQPQTVPAAPTDAGPQPGEPALAALPPGPPDSSDPRKLVNWECADLLKLADDLKVAVDKSTKDELSLSVVRKAGEIEQMAHKLRDDMRPAMAGKN